jgi:hypothetical protein
MSKLSELVAACSKRSHEIEQVLGKALGYPWFKDDQRNFPGTTEADGVCVGEHVDITLAMEASAQLAAANATVAQCKAAGWREAKHTDTFTHGDVLIAAVKKHPLGERPCWEIDLVRVDTSDDRFKLRLMNGNEWRWYWDDVRYWMPVKIPTAAEAAREGKD